MGRICGKLQKIKKDWIIKKQCDIITSHKGVKMIKSFKHKGLEVFFKTGNTKGLRSDHIRKINSILTLIDGASIEQDFNHLFKCHELKGERKGIYSMTVSGNWRITFSFENGDAYILNYEDYH